MLPLWRLVWLYANLLSDVACAYEGFTDQHDNVIKWTHFPRYCPFVRGIHRSPVNSPQKGQWRGALIFSLICVWINGRVNNREAGDLRRYRAHYDVSVMRYAAKDFKDHCIWDGQIQSIIFCMFIYIYIQIYWYAKNILIIFMITIMLINKICWFTVIGLQMTIYGNYELQFISYTMTVDYNTKIDG